MDTMVIFKKEYERLKEAERKLNVIKEIVRSSTSWEEFGDSMIKAIAAEEDFDG